MEHVHDAADPACAMAHGERPVPTGDRRLVVVFASPVARELAHFAAHVGYEVTLLDPAPTDGLAGVPSVRTAEQAGIGAGTDVVVTDHDRPELGDVLADVLAHPARWVGVMGSLRHTAPHVAALSERGVAADDVARVHRPIGLDIGSRSPAEIAVATLAGLLADRNGRTGGAFATA
jgi:xanthine dehydrogenase accessory factor